LENVFDPVASEPGAGEIGVKERASTSVVESKVLDLELWPPGALVLRSGETVALAAFNEGETDESPAPDNSPLDDDRTVEVSGATPALLSDASAPPTYTSPSEPASRVGASSYRLDSLLLVLRVACANAGVALLEETADDILDDPGIAEAGADEDEFAAAAALALFAACIPPDWLIGAESENPRR
jgi:hypothetical protein